jgi:hypothetical protein
MHLNDKGATPSTARTAIKRRANARDYPPPPTDCHDRDAWTTYLHKHHSVAADAFCVLIERSANDYTRYNNERDESAEANYQRNSDAAKLIAAVFSIRLDWPGLYPTFHFGDNPTTHYYDNPNGTRRAFAESINARPPARPIYYILKDAGIPIDSHESDLYALKTPESERILRDYPSRANVTTFLSATDGKVWYDIPFAYIPFWAAKPTRH